MTSNNQISEKRSRLGITMNSVILDLVKRECFRRCITISDFIENLVADYFDKMPKKDIPPKISLEIE